MSVIIPLYYAQDYIDALLDQLCTQPLEDIEIICVIDGSPDETLPKVKKHAEADPRIRWVYQDNAGAGVARNVGIELARGDYLAFMDADDLYSDDFLATMYAVATEHDADLVVCQFDHIDCKTGDVVHNDGFRADRGVPIGKPFSPLDLINPFSDLFVGPVNKLYRRSMVECSALRFSATRVANDTFFVQASIASSQRIVAIGDSLIRVRRYVNPQSISSNRAQHTEDMFVGFRELHAWLIEHDLWMQYRQQYAEAWSDAFHYNASYDRNKRFIDAASHALACDEPWSEMSDKELWDAARLDTSALALKKALLVRTADKDARDLELKRITNRTSAIGEIIQILNSQYGKNLPTRTSLPKSLAAYIRRNGVRYYVGKLADRIKH